MNKNLYYTPELYILTTTDMSNITYSRVWLSFEKIPYQVQLPISLVEHRSDEPPTVHIFNSDALRFLKTLYIILID